MSMCPIGYKIRGRTGVSHLHYAEGILDWSRYHQCRERSLREHAQGFPEGSDNRKYFEEQAALSAKAKFGYDPSLRLGGCERRAGEGGFWQVSTPEAEVAWRRHARARDRSDDTPLDHCDLVLDFDTRHAVIRNQGLTAWQDCLPDGWTYEFAEMPECVPDDEAEFESPAVIRAEVHSDDYVFEIDFDAGPWFACADDEEIIALAKCGWGGDYPADAVAIGMTEVPAIAEMFHYLERIADLRSHKDMSGFECHVNEEDALKWLEEENRPDLLDQVKAMEDE